jgi:GT2 family glycosyltransferase
MNKVAIIIVNWNGVRFLEDCFNAIYSQSFKNFDIYLVDNGSIDSSINFVKNNFSKVKIIALEKNTGFAKGNNIGIKEVLKDSDVDYIACLNNDTIVYSNWLEELLKTAKKDEMIGAVSSKAYFDDKKTIQNAGLKFYKVLQSNKKGGISIGFGLNDKEAPELSKDIKIFAAGGVAPLYKRKVLEKLLKRDGEIFDEDFFAYAEDYDLGFRINGLGYKSFLSANAKLIHLHSKTGGVASPFKSYYCERNSILTAIKNLPVVDLFLFPFRNFYLKMSYLLNKNESVEKLKSNIGFFGMLLILIKANFSALYLMPKFLIKRWRILYKKYE